MGRVQTSEDLIIVFIDLCKKLNLKLHRNEMSIKKIYNGDENELDNQINNLASVASLSQINSIKNAEINRFNASY